MTDTRTKIGDYAFRPSPDVYPETIEHWAAWLAVGMILILQAKTLEDAKEITNVRLREATDVVYGIQAFPPYVVADWREHVRKPEPVSRVETGPTGGGE